ncbi:flagellin [Sphingomonas canadensis]|uniref:Flagellin n=1 Tax=Sphingomonas canadensis TaxID=1219257 RepID=A0ABW3H260_9SPHN|nr:flagellin [Sphingomonas canadensis]MCW3834851.1 flagellin [Sphingomonas canadensis]
MRITTSQIYERPSLLMGKLGQQADKLQTQIATTKRFSAPSEDPTAWLRVDGLARASANDAAYASNVKLAQSVLAQSDSTLDGIATQLQRAQELALEAGGPALTDANRQSIAASLDAVIEDLFQLANAKDVRGQPLFGGAAGDAAYVRTADGSITYAGTGEPAAIPVADGHAIQPSVTGDKAFGDIFAVLTTLSAALKDGEGPGDAGDSITQAIDQVSAARSSVGARALRMDLEAQRLTDAETARAETRSGLEDTDIATAIAELQKTLTVLQATQTSFTKLSGLSLFDYLR